MWIALYTKIIIITIISRGFAAFIKMLVKTGKFYK